jgi:hypothetical protein
MEKLLTVGEVAEWLSLSRARVRTLCARGRFVGAVRFRPPGAGQASWRIPWRSVAACLEVPGVPVDVRPPGPPAGHDPATVAEARRRGLWKYVRQG